MIYNLIGKSVVKFIVFGMRRKFVLRTAVLAGAGVVAGVTAVGVTGYLLTRGDVPEA